MRADTGKLPRTKPGDSHFARCGHPNTPANHTSQKKCKQCVKESNARYQAKLAAKSGKAPKTKAEPDPVPAIAPKIEVAKVAVEVRQSAVAIANAAKWQKQCPLLNFETGARCSLMLGHEGLHSSSGRLFKTGLNPAELGGTSARAIDAEAVRGRG